MSNIVTGSPMHYSADQKNCLPTLVVLVDSLALAMDFEISPRPSNVLCDVFLAICGQPVIVLTVVDEDRDSEAVKLHHTSVATGVTSALLKFMDESINIVSGVIQMKELDPVDTFRNSLVRIAKDSALFVTPSSLKTNPTKYEKIVTAFWAGVAETRSVISTDGGVDTDYLRFLTKDQCVILMENINKKEVEVWYQSGTGATTLMLEVARRLSRLDSTLLVLGSSEEKDRLESVYSHIMTAVDMTETELSNYTNIVDESGSVTGEIRGKFWRFIKVYSDEEILLQNTALKEKENAGTDERIRLDNSDVRERLDEFLLKQTETLILVDLILRDLILTRLPGSLTLVSTPNKDWSYHGDHVGIRIALKFRILEGRDLFPYLADIIRQDKCIIPYLQTKTDYLQLATPGEPEIGEKYPPSYLRDEDWMSLDLEEKINEEFTTKSPNTGQEETSECQPVEWVYMQHLLQELSSEGIKDIITDLIHEGVFPVPNQQPVKSDTATGDDRSRRRRELMRCHVYPLRALQYGTVKGRDLYRILKNLITSDQKVLTSLRTQSDQLERVYGCTIHVAGELDTVHSGLLACPPMKLNSERVNKGLAVSEDELELVNMKESGRDHHINQFQKYWGTCSRLPLPPFSSTLTGRLPRYWETHTRLRVKRDLSGLTLLEMAVCGKEDIDTKWFVCRQKRSSWALRVGGCDNHSGVCTLVFGAGSQYSDCQTDTLPNTPGTDALVKFGVVLDVERGKLAFIDINKGRVLYTFNDRFTEPLLYMFGVGPWRDDCDTKMRLVSGSEIKMTDKKKSLIASTLFS